MFIRCHHRWPCPGPGFEIPLRSFDLEPGKVIQGERTGVTNTGLQESGNHLLLGLGEGLLALAVVLVPGGRRPNLGAVSCTDDGQFTLEPCVIAKGRRDGDAVLLIRNFRTRPGEEQSQKVTPRLRGEGSIPKPLHVSVEIFGCEDVDATLLPPRQN